MIVGAYDVLCLRVNVCVWDCVVFVYVSECFV